MSSIAIFLAGPPATKGSVKFFQARSGRVGLRNDNERTASWSKSLAWLARAKINQQHGHPTYAPFEVMVRVTLERPNGHFTRGRKRVLRDDAPWTVTKRPDVDKVLRAVLDALTGVMWHDDSMVVRAEIAKRWAEPGEEAGTHVEVSWP